MLPDQPHLDGQRTFKKIDEMKRSSSCALAARARRRRHEARVARSGRSDDRAVRTATSRAAGSDAAEAADEANLESNAPRAGMTFSVALGAGITMGDGVGRGPALSFRIGHVATPLDRAHARAHRRLAVPSRDRTDGQRRRSSTTTTSASWPAPCTTSRARSGSAAPAGSRRYTIDAGENTKPRTSVSAASSASASTSYAGTTSCSALETFSQCRDRRHARPDVQHRPLPRPDVLLSEHFDDDGGDVVLAAALVRERDRRLGALLELAVAAQLGDLVVAREVAVQAVAAQQEAIADRDVDVGGVDLDVVLVADRARDDVLAARPSRPRPSSSCRA